ncbi:hypothetical protein JCM8547_005094 [Rhodosporidiobolus lusitaniae]
MPFASFGRRSKKTSEDNASGLRRVMSKVPSSSSVDTLTEKDAHAELEQRWDAWEEQYRNGTFDLENPVSPPHLIARSNSVVSRSFQPYSTPTYQPRRHSDDGLHQRTLDALNIYGTPENRRAVMNRLRALHPYSGRPDSPNSIVTTSSSSSLIDNSLCHEIVSQACLIFDKSAVLSVLDGDKLVFLAAAGQDRNVPFFSLHSGFLPRSASFDAHTVLNRGKGFVVPDARKDWRFCKNNFHLSFYAGFPITVPVDLLDPNSKRVPIGTLSLVDCRPRPVFTQVKRSQLSTLADQASSAIENWARSRLEPHARIAAWARQGPADPLPSRFSFSTSASERGPTSISLLLEDGNSSFSFPIDPPLASKWSATTATINTAAPPVIAPPSSAAPPPAPAPLVLPSTQFLLDLAVSSVSSRLAAPLVYVLSIKLSPTHGITKRIVSCHGDREAYLNFAGQIHLKAMRGQPEGIKYEPRHVPDDIGLAGGRILPVKRTKHEESGEEEGMVLACFVEDKDKVPSEDDLAFVHEVVKALADHAK